VTCELIHHRQPAVICAGERDSLIWPRSMWSRDISIDLRGWRLRRCTDPEILARNSNIHGCVCVRSASCRRQNYQR